MQETKEEEAKKQSEKDSGDPRLKTENLLSQKDFGEETNVESQEKQRRQKKRLKIKKS